MSDGHQQAIDKCVSNGAGLKQIQGKVARSDQQTYDTYVRSHDTRSEPRWHFGGGDSSRQNHHSSSEQQGPEEVLFGLLCILGLLASAAALAHHRAKEKCPSCGKRRKLKATEVQHVQETCKEDGYLIRDLSCGHCG